VSLRRDHHGRVYEILVCPYHGHANVGCCDREAIVVEVVPVQQLRELQAARDRLADELRTLRGTRQVVFKLKGAALFGSREAVATANAAVADLTARARAAADR
jgi:hypothetical protein